MSAERRTGRMLAVGLLAFALAACTSQAPPWRGSPPDLSVGSPGPSESPVAGSEPPGASPPGTSTPADPPAAATSGVVPLQKPDPDITPGLVLTINRDDMCTPGWSSDHRVDLPARDKRDVLAAYGLPLTTQVSEWDHLISLELGGGNGRLNIWPQLDHAQDTRKDGLENRLHALVCHGSIMPAEAQEKIRNFWLWW